MLALGAQHYASGANSPACACLHGLLTVGDRMVGLLRTDPLVPQDALATMQELEAAQDSRGPRPIVDLVPSKIADGFRLQNIQHYKLHGCKLTRSRPNNLSVKQSLEGHLR